MNNSRKHWLSAGILGLLVVLAVSPLHAAKRPWIGIYMQDVNRDLAEAFDLKTTDGVLVNDVAEDSPADEAGIEPKDIILAWNGAAVKDSDALTELVRASKIGDKANLSVNRDGKEMNISVEIGERREPQMYGFGGEGDADSDDWAPRGFAFLDNMKTTGIGVSMQSLSGDLGEYFGVPEGEGALITEVMKDTPAEKAGLKVGDVVVEVNGEIVETPGDVSSELRGKDRGETVELTIVRDKAKQKVSLEIDEIESFGMNNMPENLREMLNWNGNRGGTYHNWATPQVDQEDFMRKMEELQKRLDEMKVRLDGLEKKMK
ncbi:MAG: PDZ domain-containing protein [Candidatus Zixiibacteriota bacterium]